jgi:hypothetical protein
MSDSLPLDEVPENRGIEASINRSIPKHWIVLGLLVLVHAVLGRVCGFFIDRDNPLGYMISGFVLSQPILIAIWAALAPQRFYIRFLWSLGLCTLIFFAVGYGLSLKESPDAIFFTMIDIIVFIVAALIFLFIRRLSGWQIIHSYTKPTSGDYQAYQFGIKHLIILTTIFAVSFGLFRTLRLISSQASFPKIVDFVRPVCEIIIVLFPIIIIPCFTLTNQKNKLLSILYAVFMLGIFNVGAMFMFKWFELHPDPIKIFLYVQLGASLSMFVTTYVLRLCGFRMTRVPASSGQADT